MKKLLFLFFLLPIISNANSVKINGIYYSLSSTRREAEVEGTAVKYTGNVFIPKSVEYDGVTYSVTSIGTSAFAGCTDLTSVTIPNTVTSFKDWSFYKCSKLTSITIPNSVTSIGRDAFRDCSGLTSVTIPNSVTTISPHAFISCTKLASVSIGDGVTTLEDNIFYGCSSLMTVTIGKGMKKISQHAFGLCPKLSDVYCLAEQVPKLSYDAFLQSNIEKATLHVPAVLINDYKSSEYWKSFKIIVAIDVEGLEFISANFYANDVQIQRKGSTLTVSGVIDGTPICVYTLSGHCVGLATATTTICTIRTTLYKSEPCIVKIGEKTNKMLLNCSNQF